MSICKRTGLSDPSLTAQCLYVLTDDNPPAAAHVRSDGSWINTIVEIIRSGVSVSPESPSKGKGRSDGMEGVEQPVQGAKKDLLLRILAAGSSSFFLWTSDGNAHDADSQVSSAISRHSRRCCPSPAWIWRRPSSSLSLINSSIWTLRRCPQRHLLWPLRW